MNLKKLILLTTVLLPVISHASGLKVCDKTEGKWERIDCIDSLLKKEKDSIQALYTKINSISETAIREEASARGMDEKTTLAIINEQRSEISNAQKLWMHQLKSIEANCALYSVVFTGGSGGDSLIKNCVYKGINLHKNLLSGIANN